MNHNKLQNRGDSKMKKDCRHLQLVPTVEEHKIQMKKNRNHMLHQRCHLNPEQE